MATARKPAYQPAAIEKQIQTIRDDVAKLMTMVAEVGEDELSEQAQGTMEEIRTLVARSTKMAYQQAMQVKKTANAVEDFINEKPVQSTLIALLAGVLIGKVSGR